MLYKAILKENGKEYKLSKIDTHPSHIVRAIIERNRQNINNESFKVKVMNQEGFEWIYNIKYTDGKYMVTGGY
jgi:hypothetical protein